MGYFASVGALMGSAARPEGNRPLSAGDISLRDRDPEAWFAMLRQYHDTETINWNRLFTLEQGRALLVMTAIDVTTRTPHTDGTPLSRMQKLITKCIAQEGPLSENATAHVAVAIQRMRASRQQTKSFYNDAVRTRVKQWLQDRSPQPTAPQPSSSDARPEPVKKAWLGAPQPTTAFYTYAKPAVKQEGETTQRNDTRACLCNYLQLAGIDMAEGRTLEKTLTEGLYRSLTTMWRAQAAPMGKNMTPCPRYRISDHKGRHIIVAHMPAALLTTWQYEAVERTIQAFRQGHGAGSSVGGANVIVLVLLVFPEPEPSASPEVLRHQERIRSANRALAGALSLPLPTGRLHVNPGRARRHKRSRC
jgi:hypothetical protein